MSDKLKPCPCCGLKDSIRIVYQQESVYVLCSSVVGGCGLRMVQGTEALAMQKWNTRLQSSEPES